MESHEVETPEQRVQTLFSSLEPRSNIRSSVLLVLRDIRQLSKVRYRSIID